MNTALQRCIHVKPRPNGVGHILVSNGWGRWVQRHYRGQYKAIWAFVSAIIPTPDPRFHIEKAG